MASPWHLGGEGRLARDDEAGRLEALWPDQRDGVRINIADASTAATNRESLRQLGALYALRRAGASIPLPHSSVE